MRLDLQAPGKRLRIGLTPLIDVVFILLLFFLVASQLDQWRALPLSTPTAAIRDLAVDETPAMLIRVHADGRLDLNGVPLEPSRLVEALETQRIHHPDLMVVLQSDPDLELQALVSVMDGIKAAGVRGLSLR